MTTAVLRGELKANFAAFSKQWKKELAKVARTLGKSHKKPLLESYIRIASIQAWRTSVIESKMGEDAAAFFFEAQNDLLTSHCLATCGSFRQALKALRSSIENVLNALYFMDHSIELELWLQGSFRKEPRELREYFEKHPKLNKHVDKTGLPELKAQYAVTSKAVHASAKQFRMTTDLSDTKLWVDDPITLNKWSGNEKAIILAFNALLLHLFADELTGAKNKPLRDMLALVIPKGKHADIKSRLGVTLHA